MRTTRFKHTGFLSFVPRVVIFRALVNQLILANTTLSFIYDTVTFGAYTDIRVGQTLILYHQSTSTVKAVLRVAGGGASATVIQVNEVSRGDVVFSNNDTVEVVAEFDPRDMLVSNTAAFLKDGRIQPGTFPSNPPPIANSGGPRVGWIDPITSVLTVDHEGSTSWRVDPDAGTISHDWDFVDASPGTSTAADPSAIEYPEGFRWVEHLITDSNGTTDVEYVPVWAHGDTYPPLRVRVNSRGASVDQGFHSLDFAVPRAAALEVQTMPERALICYWELETRDGVTTTAVKFVGYLDTRSIGIVAGSDTLGFTAIGPVGILAVLGALSQVLKSGTTSKWGYIKTLTVWRALWYLLYWGSTIKLVHDLVMADGDEFLYSQITIDNVSSIKGQVGDDLAPSIAVKFGSDALGRMLFVRSLPFLSVAERAARTKIVDFTTANSVSVAWEETFRPQTKLVLIDAISADSNADNQDAIFGWAPGDAPGEGTEVGTLDKQIVVDETEAYQRAGNERARLNGTYYTAATKSTRRVPMGVRLTVMSSEDIVDPILGDPVGFTLPATTNTLGISFADTELWVVREMSVTYDASAGTKTVEYVLDHETLGQAGKSRPNPNGSTTGIDTDLPDFGSFNPTPLPSLTPYDLITLKKGTQSIFAINDDGYWYRCGPALTGAGFDTPAANGGPVYERDSLGISGTLCDAALIPESMATGSVDGWLASTTGVYKVEDSGGTPTISLSHAFAHTVSGIVGIETTINLPGFVMAVYYDIVNGMYAAWSLDTGATWTETLISADVNTDTGVIQRAAVALSIETANKAYAVAFTATGGAPTLLDTFTINVKSTSYSLSNISLTNGVDYTITVSGIWDPHGGTGRLCDAFWMSGVSGNWSTHTFIRTVDFDGGRGELDSNDNTYTASHVYTYTITGDGNPLGARVDDSGFDPGQYGNNSGTMTVTIYAVPSVANAVLFESDDHGATWAEAGGLDVDCGIVLPGCLHFPWHNNAAESRVYFGRLLSDQTSHLVLRADGLTASDLTPEVSGSGYGIRWARSLATGTSNRDVVLAALTNGTDTIIVRSVDGGASWTVLETGSALRHCHVPDDATAGYLWGDAALAYLQDGVIDDRSGNLSEFSGVGRFVNLWGLP